LRTPNVAHALACRVGSRADGWPATRILPFLSLAALFFSTTAPAQLIPTGAPIPKTAKPPVVFLNGYQYQCTGSSQFSDTFGKFDQFLQTTGRVSILFDNCAFPGKPTIEDLGNRFATFLGGLKYQDGTAVTQVDIVAHSLGGLIVRSYLAGMQTDGTFTPPATLGLRKTVFLDTPNFGSDLAVLFGSDIQTTELSTASTFLFNLATWNQGTDDLRGIDVLAVAGNGGVGATNGNPNTDGVSSLNSSSIGFAVANRTRVLPYCHIPYADIVAIAGSDFLAGFVCKSGSPGIAKAILATDTNVQIVQSYLNDTPDWQTIGQAAEQNPVLTTQAGVILRSKSPDDKFLTMQDAAIGTTPLSVPSNAASASSVAYKEFLASGASTAKATTSAGVQQQPVNLAAGYTTAVTLKTGPFISRVLPAAAVVSPLNVAPGTFVAIYGSGFATANTTATTTPFPTTLAGVQVLVNGTAIPLYFVSPNQIDAVFPLTISGSVTVAVTFPGNQSTVRVLTAPAVPALFTQDNSGTGAASALNAVTGALITPAAPLRSGDYVSLYLTGLGTKTLSNGFQAATIQPTVTVGGKPCVVQFAGATPLYAGLDQINCQIPSGLTPSATTPVVVTSGGRNGNTVTLAIR
jgi:uncharacterized protein (TIGR03437 family)